MLLILKRITFIQFLYAEITKHNLSITVISRRYNYSAGISQIFIRWFAAELLGEGYLFFPTSVYVKKSRKKCTNQLIPFVLRVKIFSVIKNICHRNCTFFFQKLSKTTCVKLFMKCLVVVEWNLQGIYMVFCIVTFQLQRQNKKKSMRLLILK